MNGKKRVIIRVGDIYKVPITKKKHAYAQYYHQWRLGSIIRVFDVVTSKDLKPEEIIKFDLLFPPKHMGLRPAVREGGWEKIGNLPVKDFVMPKFKSGLPDNRGVVNNWWLIDGDKTISLGEKLPNKYKKLERSGTWSYHDIVKRIKNKGKIPYKAWE